MAQAWQTPQLQGRHVRLVPLALAHVDGLRRAAADGQLWNLHFTSVPRATPGDAEAYVQAALDAHAAGTEFPFAVLDVDGEVVGSTRYYRVERSVPRLLLGYTWYAQRVQRSGLNTEAKLLLLQHAFDVFGCECVALETSHQNLRSQAAILRLGAKRDGVIRAEKRHRDGSLRDTHVFSILRAEWPAVKQGLIDKLNSHEVPNT